MTITSVINCTHSRGHRFALAFRNIRVYPPPPQWIRGAPPRACACTRPCMRSMRKINSVHDLHIHPVSNTCPLTNYVSARALRCAARLKSKYNFSLFIKARPLLYSLLYQRPVTRSTSFRARFDPRFFPST